MRMLVGRVLRPSPAAKVGTVTVGACVAPRGLLRVERGVVSPARWVLGDSPRGRGLVVMVMLVGDRYMANIAEMWSCCGS